MDFTHDSAGNEVFVGDIIHVVSNAWDIRGEFDAEVIHIHKTTESALRIRVPKGLFYNTGVGFSSQHPTWNLFPTRRHGHRDVFYRVERSSVISEPSEDIYNDLI